MEDLEKSGEKLKMNEPEKQKLDEHNSWQRAKDVKLYDYTQLPSTQKVESLIALGSQHKGSKFFCVWFFVVVVVGFLGVFFASAVSHFGTPPTKELQYLDRPVLVLGPQRHDGVDLTALHKPP